MESALTLRYEAEDILNFLSRADKVYNQAEVGENVKFELLHDALKSDQMFSSLRCSEDSRTIRA